MCCVKCALPSVKFKAPTESRQQRIFVDVFWHCNFFLTFAKKAQIYLSQVRNPAQLQQYFIDSCSLFWFVYYFVLFLCCQKLILFDRCIQSYIILARLQQSECLFHINLFSVKKKKEEKEKTNLSSTLVSAHYCIYWIFA